MDLSLSLLGSSADDFSASAWFLEGIQHMGECPASSTFLDLTWNEALSFRSMQVESGWINSCPTSFAGMGRIAWKPDLSYVLELAPQSDGDWFLSGILKSAQQDAIPMNNAILVGSGFSEGIRPHPLRLFDGNTGLLMLLEKVKAFGNWKAPTTFSLDPNLLPPARHDLSAPYRAFGVSDISFFRIRR